MPLVGDVRRIPLPRLLVILTSGRRSGRLTVRSGRVELAIQIRRGRLQQAWPLKGPSPTEALVAARADDEHRADLKALAEGGDAGAILLLEFFGLCPRDQSVAEMREQTLAMLRKAAGWRKGEFSFDYAAALPTGTLNLDMPLGPVAKQLAEAG